MARGADHSERVPEPHPDLLVRPVDVVDDQERLRGIAREAEVPLRSATERLFRDERFLDERAVLAKYLQPIVRAIAHVDETVARDAHRVDDAELRRWRAGWIVLTRLV